MKRSPALATVAWLVVISIAPAQGQPAPSPRGTESDVLVERNVMIPMRDGVRLAADIYRPAKGETPPPSKFPALLARTPYNKGNGDNAEAKWFAARGYAVVVNDVRGRYASEGTWRLIADDAEDGFDMVEWIARQEWSDGKVGTYGTSYLGGTQHALASMNPPHLTAMIPTDALSNCGVAGMRHGGAFELRFVNWIFQIGAPNAKTALADPALQGALTESGRRIREHVAHLPIRPGTSPLRIVPEYEAWLAEAFASGPESPFWKIKGMSVVDHVKEYADVPVWHVTGWYDSWTRQVVMNYDALSKAKTKPHHLLIGPWVHGSQGSNIAGEVEFTEDAKLDWNAVRLRWFDAWLKGDRDGLAKEPPIWIYVMGTGNDRKSAAGRLLHGGSWRAEKEWPPARAVATTYHLHGDGTLAREAPLSVDDRTTYTFDPAHPVPTIGGNISSNQGLMTSGGYDQRPRDDTAAAIDGLPLSERPDIVVFRTAPLKEDVEVTGTVTVTLYASTTAKDTDFTAKLIDEIPPNPDYPLGFDLNIGDSILRARYRDGLNAAPKPVTPGEIFPVTITLYPTSNVFKKGHRIRLDISSSNFPRFDANPNTGDFAGRDRRTLKADNTIWHDLSRPSRVVLPVIPKS